MGHGTGTGRTTNRRRESCGYRMPSNLSKVIKGQKYNEREIRGGKGTSQLIAELW